MGKRIKRGKKGNVAQYLTRNQAIKKLQLRLADFRRLCILKGIHPREPKKKFQGANKTYYHVKDINWLAHEPLIHTFRAIKVHDKKVRKAAAKQNMLLARRLMRHKPGYKLDRLVKERYPSFTDALRDLDDALTLVHLFATLPADSRYRIPGPMVTKCRRIVMEWQAYCARTCALRKVFISVKGFYYQAELAGQSVTWLVPHQLSQVLPPDVDYRIMITFLEFYTTLLQFVLFRLYHGLGLKYPPVLDQQLERAASALAGIMRDIAGLAATADAQCQQQQLENGSNGAAEPAADDADEARGGADDSTPDIVRRITSLGDKIKQIQQQQGADGQQQQEDAAEGDSGSAGEGLSSDEEDDLGMDSGASDSEAEEGSAQEGDSDDGEAGEDEEEEASQDEAGSSSEEEEEGVAAGGAAEPAGVSLELSAEARAAGEPSTSGAAALVDGAAAAGGGLGLVSGDDDAEVCATLLRGCVVFLAREVPREPLLFIIRSFGGVAAWEGEGSPHQEGDEAITHQVVDRPTQGHRFLSRAYVQPQWVVDSVNARCLLPVQLYAPGAMPPPHLSPFVDYEQEGYMPDFARTVQQLQEAAKRARQRAAGAVSEAEFMAAEGDDAAAVAAAADNAASEEAAAAAAERVYRQELAKELQGTAAADESEEEEEPQQEQQQPGGKQQQEQPEGELMADIMMTRKNRKLYERIKRAQAGKAERVDVLEQRKRRLQQEQQQPADKAQQQRKQQQPRGKKKKLV